MSTTVVFDLPSVPKVTLTLDDAGTYTAVLEVADMAPQRAVTLEEQSVGIVSLDPPTVRIAPKLSETQSQAHRRLIDASQRAVASAAESSTGETGGPGGILMTYYRVAKGVRSALRLLDEDAL